VAHAVLRLVHQSGRKVEEGVLVDFPVTRQEIAEVSGPTSHSVSRVLSAWENAGLVVVGRQKVIVCDLERLSRIAEESKPRALGARARLHSGDGRSLRWVKLGSGPVV